ncbi:MAG: XrtA system polysaccharide deacetylase [Parahaliea sp.]
MIQAAPQYTAIRNAMSVDVEDYYQVSAFEKVVNRDDWATMPSRVERNVDRILELFDTAGTKATFFTLGMLAERHPDMVRRIHAQGHELASHGWSHVRVTQQQPAEFSEDIRRTKQTLEDISGAPVLGYRAASYSIGASNLWALDELAKAGYVYSSSIVPIKHDLYGMPEASRFPFLAADERLLEIPVSTIPVLGKNINCGGGGWFRLFPYVFSRWAIHSLNNKEKQSAIFYFHPWEIDPEQPRIHDAPFRSRFRHYLNLERMQKRLGALLQDFSWGRVDEVYGLVGDEL